MSQRNVMGTAAGRHRAPARSASAARAHDNGDVTWVVDLGQPAAVRVGASTEASQRYAVAGLSLLMLAVWLFNIVTLVTGGAG